MTDPRISGSDSLALYQDEHAYLGVREWVLTRKTDVGEALNVHSLALRLDVDDERIENALTQLRLEGLVTPESSGLFTAQPISLERTMGLFDSRAVIETGVVELYGAHLSAVTIDKLAQIAEELRGIIAEPMPGFERFLQASRSYHATLISCAHSDDLMDAYNRLAITELWRGSLANTDWWNRFDVTHHGRLTNALRNRDVDTAKHLVRDHREQVKNLVRGIFEERGGFL